MENNLNKKLIMAVKVGYLEGVQGLLIEGADPNWKGEEEASALDWAKSRGEVDIKDVLEKSMVSYKKDDRPGFYKVFGRKGKQ